MQTISLLQSTMSAMNYNILQVASCQSQYSCHNKAVQDMPSLEISSFEMHNPNITVAIWLMLVKHPS